MTDLITVKVKELTAAINSLRRERDVVIKAFNHYHVAANEQHPDPPGYPDKCVECGLDIRHPVHTRENRDGP